MSFTPAPQYLVEESVRKIFNSHLRKNFKHIQAEERYIESEWAIFHASIAEAPTLTCGCNVASVSHLGGHPGFGRLSSWRRRLIGPCWLVGLQRQLRSIRRPSRSHTKNWLLLRQNLKRGRGLVSLWMKTLNRLWGDSGKPSCGWGELSSTSLSQC